MNRACWSVVAVVVSYLAVSGCRSLSSRPNIETLDHFALIDAIELEGHESTVRIDDPALIAGLREIYSSARWKPYIATMPAGMRRISGLKDGDELFGISYFGSLMERKSGDIRYAELSHEDRTWIDRLFSDHGLDQQ